MSLLFCFLSDDPLSGGTQGMVEVIAENYHNIWAKKKKLELESKGEPGSQHPPEGELGQVCFPRSAKEEPNVLLSLILPTQVVAVTLFWFRMTP